MKNSKNLNTLLLLIIIMLLLVVGTIYVLNSNGPIDGVAIKTSTLGSNGLKLWKNEKLNYSFTYPKDAVVTYSKDTPDGACTYVTFAGKNSTTSVSIIDGLALSRYPEPEYFFCTGSDAPFGKKSKEKIVITSLNNTVEASCHTHYFHKESFDSNNDNDKRNGILLSEIPSDSVYTKICYFILSQAESVPTHGTYIISTEYGTGIPVKEIDEMSAKARQTISSFKKLR